MTPLDYGRSFIIGNGPSNEVRFWVESRTRIIDETTGAHEDYLQTGSCKSENTFAESDLFHEDNYDFLPIFGPEYGVIFRRKARFDTNYKSCVSTVAFNASHFADFILEVPTPLHDSDKDDRSMRVYHYSKRVSMAATNRLYAITG